MTETKAVIYARLRTLKQADGLLIDLKEFLRDGEDRHVDGGERTLDCCKC